jgi:ParB/RepB/Spo0J family partition protein
MISQIKEIAIKDIDPHPRNPRLVQREDIIEAIHASIQQHGFDPAHALIVRALGKRFEIISGHHRHIAADRAKLAVVPAWIREMSDEEAYMALVLNNTHGELTALERGMHALHSGMDVKAYAESVGRARTSVHNEVYAAKVADTVPHMGNELSNYFRHLTEIHAAPLFLWPVLVNQLIIDDLTVDATRKMVAEVKDAPEPKKWMNGEAIATNIVTGAMRKTEIQKMLDTVDDAIASIQRADLKFEAYTDILGDRLIEAKPSRLSEVMAICSEIQEEQGRDVAVKRKREHEEQQKHQDRESSIATMRSNVSLAIWKTLEPEVQAMLLDTSNISTASSFNKQDNDAIEWAQFSWNPVTGCLHDCPYCYARDIAHSARMAKVYPHGFEPAFRPAALLAPVNTKVPKEAGQDTRFRNVFTCSMADLFGRWVPAEWIEAVLQTVRSNPQWNFLFLTKFPKRMSEFNIPSNAWMGTTVDLQARVSNAESAFAKVTAGVRWLSVEPMLEPLKFKRLDLFQWIVIGGSSRSSQTPEWKPPFEWIADLTRQAKEAGVKVYHKTNLLGSRLLELPFDAPIIADPSRAPEVFHYLGKGKVEVEAAA